METTFTWAMVAVAITLVGQTAAVGIWIGRMSEKQTNLAKRQDTMGLEVEDIKKAQGLQGNVLARLQGLFNGRHEVT